MKRVMRPVVAGFFAIIFIGAIATDAFSVKGDVSELKPLLKAGDAFPDLPIKTPENPKDINYLGIQKGQNFKLKDIKADLVMVEVMSVFCGVCQKIAPVFNKVFSMVESNSETKGRIKMVAISMGDMASDIKVFRNHFKIKYPIVPDTELVLHKSIGNKYTPFTIFVRQLPSGQAGLVVKTHETPVDNPEKIFKEMRSLLDKDLKAIQEKKH